MNRRMKIDFHVHITPPEIKSNWQKYAEKEPYFAMLGQSPANKFADAGEIIAALDKAAFDKAVVFGFGFRDLGLCRLVNDYVIETAGQFSEKLCGFIAVSPNAKGMEKEIDRCHAAGLKGIGEIFPAGQGFCIDDGQRTKTFAGICAERKLPVILHVNEPVGHGYAGKTETGMREIERFIKNNQNIDIVLAHWGGGFFLYETMPEIREMCRRVYYDTAASPFIYDESIYHAALAMGLSRKILFGSDFPLLPQSRYMQAITALSDTDRRLILGGNAERLLINEQGVISN
jgi:predicted TIM-barrel fold metal-dependent hydrolase